MLNVHKRAPLNKEEKFKSAFTEIVRRQSQSTEELDVLDKYQAERRMHRQYLKMKALNTNEDGNLAYLNRYRSGDYRFNRFNKLLLKIKTRIELDMLI